MKVLLISEDISFSRSMTKENSNRNEEGNPYKVTSDSMKNLYDMRSANSGKA